MLTEAFDIFLFLASFKVALFLRELSGGALDCLMMIFTLMLGEKFSICRSSGYCHLSGIDLQEKRKKDGDTLLVLESKTVRASSRLENKTKQRNNKKKLIIIG